MVCLCTEKIKIIKETESLIHHFRSKWNHIKFLKIAIPIDTIQMKTEVRLRVHLDEVSVKVSGNDVQRV